VIQYWFEKHRDLQKRRAEEGFDGFTLIELLIVIVVLGILAATVIFALGGVTGQSAQAACQSDAKSVETAMEAYHSFPGNSTNAYPGTIADLLSGGAYGQFLHAAPNNTHYVVLLYQDTGHPTGAVAGHVYVGPTAATAVDYDTETSTTGCNAVT
jgi:general secretion pathway protein G